MAYIVKQTTGAGRIYIHLAVNHHIPELQQARQHREHLGVLDPDTGELLLSQKRNELPPEIIELLKKAGISYYGNRACSRRKQQTITGNNENNLPSAIEDVGEMYVLLHLCHEYGLDQCLDVFDEDGQALLYLAIWQACTGDPQYLAADWLESRSLPCSMSDFDFSSTGMSALMRRIGSNKIIQDRFFKEWIKKLNFPKSVIYDTTSISTYSDHLDDAEWGYNRDKEKLPQINMALVTDSQTGLPLAFRLLPGSISDVVTLTITSEFLREYGLKNFSYCLDRGFYSNANIKMLLKEKLQFIIGVPMTSTQAKEIVRMSIDKFKSSSCSILFNGSVLRFNEETWTVELDDQNQNNENIKNNKEKIQAYIFLDQERSLRQSQDLEKKIIEIEKIASKVDFYSIDNAKLWIEENAKQLSKYFKVIEDKTPKVIRNTVEIDALNSIYGISLYIANLMIKEKFDPENTLAIIRGRDVIEKIIDIIKNDNEQYRIRTGDMDIAIGRVLLAFLSAIVRYIFQIRLRKANLNKSLTIDEALTCLRKIRAVRFESGKRICLEIPKKTRKLLEKLGIELPQ